MERNSDPCSDPNFVYLNLVLCEEVYGLWLVSSVSVGCYASDLFRVFLFANEVSKP